MPITFFLQPLVRSSKPVQGAISLNCWVLRVQNCSFSGQSAVTALPRSFLLTIADLGSKFAAQKPRTPARQRWLGTRQDWQCDLQNGVELQNSSGLQRRFTWKLQSVYSHLVVMLKKL